jgi:hypothetical protein
MVLGFKKENWVRRIFMSLTTLDLIIASECLSSIAQVVLKAGVSGTGTVAAFAQDTPADIALAMIAEPLVWLTDRR